MRIWSLFIFLLVLLAPSAASAQGMSTICQFTNGPRAGQSQDYAPMAAIPVGSSCQDGAGSSGFVVARSVPAPIPGQAGMSTICQFTNGPRAGQSQDYAPMAAIPIGSSCQDGFGSFGQVGSALAASAKSATCLYYNGPQRGYRQFFPNFNKVDIGIPCSDGRNNYGVTVADDAGNSYTNNWSGVGVPDATLPPPPNIQPTSIPQANATPLEVGRNCALSTGGNEAAMAACVAHGLPPNVTQQCLADPSSCFGKLSPITGNVFVAKKIAQVSGIKLDHLAGQVDKVWNKINPF